MPTNEELIRQMYDGNLASQTAQLQQSYQKADSEYVAAKEKNAKATDANLTRTAVEGQKAAMNMAQLHDAQGLSSGTRAQARMSLENQTMANMTALRAAQQQSDADIERQRALLAQDYAAAISKAQADNDLQKAQALYEQAKQAEADLLSKKEATAELLAKAGDFSLLQELRGLTDNQVQLLKDAYRGENGGKVPDGYKVTNITGDGYVVIGNSKIPTADLEAALASGQIIREVSEENKTITYQYAHPGLTDNGAPVVGAALAAGALNGDGEDIRGSTTGAQGTSPNMNADGSYTIEGRTMTVDELIALVESGEVIETWDPVKGEYTYHFYRSNGTPGGRSMAKAFGV